MIAPTRLTPIEELCAALHSGGFVLTAESRTTLSLKPRAGCTTAMAAAITTYRAKLIDFLFGRGPITPHPCCSCGGEFVSTPSERCQDCALLVGQPLRMKPNSPEEVAFLRAYEARESSRITVPTVPASHD